MFFYLTVHRLPSSTVINETQLKALYVGLVLASIAL